MDYRRANDFAIENSYLFEVKEVTLKPSYTDKEKVQFEYAVTITATPESGEAATDITAHYPTKHNEIRGCMDRGGLVEHKRNRHPVHHQELHGRSIGYLSFPCGGHGRLGGN